MVVWLRPEYILALITSLYCSSHLVSSKTYEKFWCATEEGLHQLSCPDESALLTEISIRKVHRRTQMCEPDDHSEYLIYCQSYLDSSLCEGNKTCSITISSQDYLQCGEKTYPPTYFFVKYTCTQIHTMCVDTLPIRNTLYGYIVSPAYPHPMADNLKCSISIEADPTMYIEIFPIQIYLQEALTCRAEYLEIFGYDSSDTMTNNDNSIWKAYHTWCGTGRSLNHPQPNTRYLISSNSVYMALQTTVAKKARYFKIRYKIVPATARVQYNSDGIGFDSMEKGQASFDLGFITSTNILSTTMVIPSLNDSEVKYLNGTKTIKRTFKKEILIGIIAGVVVLLVIITTGILIFIFMKRRRSSPTIGKKTLPPTSSSSTSKSTAKSSDKAPLLEQGTNTSTATTARKLVPERTVQVSDVGASRFKPPESKFGSGTSDSSASKPILTAADSGIYGADISEEVPSIPKPVSVPAKIPDSTRPETIPEVVLNPSTENSVISAIVIHSNETKSILPTITIHEEKEPLLDNTIRSAYSHIIDATASENEGTICGSGLQSRRTSTITSSPSLLDESTNLETIVLSREGESLSHNIIPFNPLHVILKKDANKYYTTEYI